MAVTIKPLTRRDIRRYRRRDKAAQPSHFIDIVLKLFVWFVLFMIIGSMIYLHLKGGG